MILKGSQRGGSRQLAAHFLNARDNEHIEVHELRGFSADDLQGAFQEIDASSRGTRARQFLFSLSLNPPPREHVSIETFEAVTGNNLARQPPQQGSSGPMGPNHGPPRKTGQGKRTRSFGCPETGQRRERRFDHLSP